MMPKDSILPHALNTAVLFLVFNRLDTTKQVFEEIRRAKPPRLYVAADGARDDKSGEAETTQSVRDYVMQNVDWDCEVKTLFRDKNLGCKYAVSSAISWFFENEEQGIILEDDVVPNQDFFYFVENNLEKYKNDHRVMMVSGMNYFSDSSLDTPYFFSEYMNIWGWGSWRRSWDLYDVDMPEWSKSEVKKDIKNKYFSSYIWRYLRNIFNMIEEKRINTWDIQWFFCCLYNHGVCIVPKVNMVTNIGVDGTHGNRQTASHFLKKDRLDSVECLAFFPKIHVNFQYDFRLYNEKIKPQVRREDFLWILKSLHIYSVVRKFKNFLF
jgi:GR25 family glycosyltransferase involved in LPS biosynthesis